MWYFVTRYVIYFIYNRYKIKSRNTYCNAHFSLFFSKMIVLFSHEKKTYSWNLKKKSLILLELFDELQSSLFIILIHCYYCYQNRFTIHIIKHLKSWHILIATSNFFQNFATLKIFLVVFDRRDRVKDKFQMILTAQQVPKAQRNSE